MNVSSSLASRDRSAYAHLTYADLYCTKDRWNNPRVFLLSAKRAEVGLKLAEFAEQASTSRRHDATSDEGRDRWTFYIITADGMDDFHLESLHCLPEIWPRI